MIAEIETKRLWLRNFKEQDAYSMFLSYCNDDEVTKYVTWYPHSSIEVTQTFLADNILKNNKKLHMLNLAITLKEDLEFVIGDISIVDWNTNDVEIGYVLAKAYWKQGYASEALNAFVNYIFSHLEVHIIRACVDVENLASQKVLEICGFTYTHQSQEKRKFDSVDSDQIACKWYARSK